MKKQILLSCALAWAVMAGAETIDITTFRYAGPYVVQAPFQVDSVDALPLLFWPVLTNHSASTSFLVVLFNHTNLIRDFNAIVSLTYGLHFPMIP